MKFLDEVVITVQSGNGGRGCMSFRREKFVPKGGPDGGDGGAGGNVVFTATSRMRTLYHFRYKRHLKAENGKHGQGKCKTGKSGEDILIEVPEGTVISDAETGDFIADLTKSGQIFIMLEGGMGGRGNARFKTSVNQAPRYAQPGTPGKTAKIKLDLKLLADVGLIGLPNAGKSTLISAMSAARPKIDSYPFTTLTPNLGVVQTGWGEPFVAADIPGLIEGAHNGVGLGIKFLRHIERTRVLVHIIDASCINESDPLASYDTVNKELEMYSADLVKKPQIVVLNKLDIPEAENLSQKFLAVFKNRFTDFEQPLLISAAEAIGLDKLISQIAKKLAI